VVGRVNNRYIKVAKVLGELPWHSHEHEDEMFLVLRWELRIWPRRGRWRCSAAARGVRHNTSASEETWIALVETVTTLHTGSERIPLTRSIANQPGWSASRISEMTCALLVRLAPITICFVSVSRDACTFVRFSCAHGSGNPDDSLPV
jgi:hypothetical protein